MSGLIVDLTGQTLVLPVMLTGQNSIVLKMKGSCCSVVSVIYRVAVYCGTLIWNPGDVQLEPLFTIRASKHTLGFAHFRSQNYQIFLLLLVIFNFSFWVYGPLKEYFIIYIWPARSDTWPSKKEFGRSSWPETIRKLFRALRSQYERLLCSTKEIC